MNATFQPHLVPTWAKIAAWAVPLTTLPSIIWRMTTVAGGLVSGDNPCIPAATPLGERLYLLVLLPGVQLGAALLTIGLIRPWGEVLPRWLPILGGRRVPTAAAVSAAVTGSILVAAFVWFSMVEAMWGPLLVETGPTRPLPPGCGGIGTDVLRWYLPMFLWPPLLLTVTWHYAQRRQREHHPAAAAA